MLIDCREHALLSRLPPSTVSAQLPVADIWIGSTESQDAVQSHGLLIERKTVADLESSILDGRYREQRIRLVSAATTWNAHPIYIIEGDLDRLGKIRLTAQALMKHITRLSLRYQITVFQTACVEETVRLLLLLNDQWKDDPTTFERQKTLAYAETQGHTKSANRDDPSTFAIQVLTCCRGISITTAQQILKGCGGTLEGVWKASVDHIANLPEKDSGKRRIGPARAERLYALLHASIPHQEPSEITSDSPQKN